MNLEQAFYFGCGVSAASTVYMLAALIYGLYRGRRGA